MSEPIFITGYPKSGTTLIAHMFNNISGISIDIELHYAPFVLRMMTDAMNSGEVKTTTEMNDILALRCLELSENEFLRYINKCKMMFQSLHTGNMRWGNNCKQNVNFFSLIRRMYPRASIISMIRDPRDVWSSIRLSKWPGLEMFSTMDFFLAKYRKVYNQIQNSDSHVIRYEDLLTNPQMAFSLIDEEYKSEYLQGSGMIYNQRTLQQKHPDKHSDELITTRIGRYKYELSNEEIEIINTSFPDVIEKYGY